MSFTSFFAISLLGLLSSFQLSVGELIGDEIILQGLGRELGVPEWGFNGSDHCSWPGIVCSLDKSTVESLHLSSHGLRGNISLISELKSLKSIDLSYNDFHGRIPSSLGSLPHLEFLDFSYNKFEDSIPGELGSMRNLKFLNLSNNMLVGSIPDELQRLEDLQEFQVCSNKLNGFIPLWMGNLSSLRIFTAYENELIGTIPDKLGSASELQLLNLHTNQLEGSIPESIFVKEKLQALILTQNRLNGSIPESISRCRGLSSVRIGNNKLVGSLPKGVGNLSSLTYFEADDNLLSGEIPAEFAECSNLTLLNLASNCLTGTVPSELGRLTSLQELIFSGNGLFGEIPIAIVKSKNLNKLDLSNNSFNGSIPVDICNKTSRLQYLLLGQNSIRGEIPRQIGSCVKLLALQIGSNHLTGTIPAEIGRIRNLQIVLNLSFNRLQGPVPQELGRLDKLVSLDLSSNQLSGNIPGALKGMLSLIEVNFSNNEFSGAIPSFVPFQKSANSSFLGNNGLCGAPLASPCEGLNGDGHGYDHHNVSYRLVLAVISSGLVVFLSVTVVVLLFMMRERQEKAVKGAAAADTEICDNKQPTITAGNVFPENLRQAIDFDAVVKATMKDSNILTSGTFSTVYRADMPSGMVLSVKKLRSMDQTILHYQNKMVREVERLSKLCHDNLTPPIGFVIYEDVALLLHRHFPNGTLAQYLHESAAKSPKHKPDWPTRLSIAIGVAEGIAFLHHLAIIHLDISSGNVLLDSSLKPLVGEVEISKLLDPSRGTASISAVAGSFGYIPPEYAYTMQVTAPGNVYSYGVVLLEILTSRLPVDEAFGEGVDLVKWVHGASGRGETPEQILDTRLSTISFGWRKEMLVALKVALLCTDTTPAKRPRMKKVVEMLQELVQN